MPERTIVEEAGVTGIGGWISSQKREGSEASGPEATEKGPECEDNLDTCHQEELRDEEEKRWQGDFANPGHGMASLGTVH